MTLEHGLIRIWCLSLFAVLLLFLRASARTFKRTVMVIQKDGGKSSFLKYFCCYIFGFLFGLCLVLRICAFAGVISFPVKIFPTSASEILLVFGAQLKFSLSHLYFANHTSPMITHSASELIALTSATQSQLPCNVVFYYLLFNFPHICPIRLYSWCSHRWWFSLCSAPHFA